MRHFFCCIVFGIIGCSLFATAQERRPVWQSIPEEFFEIYDGILLDIVLQYGPSSFSSDGVLLLQFETEQFFDFDSDRLDLSAQRSIRDLAAVLRNQEEPYYVVIVGHTDAIGTIGYNDELSHRRGLAVSTIMDAQGVPDNQVRALPLGERYPTATNATESGRARNRRVEIYISRSREDVIEAPRSTPRKESMQNDQVVCLDGPGECGRIPAEPRPIIKPDGSQDGFLRLDDPILRSESVLRRRVQSNKRRRRVIRAPK